MTCFCTMQLAAGIGAGPRRVPWQGLKPKHSKLLSKTLLNIGTVLFFIRICVSLAGLCGWRASSFGRGDPKQCSQSEADMVLGSYRWAVILHLEQMQMSLATLWGSNFSSWPWAFIVLGGQLVAESLLGGERRENSDSEDEPLICDGSPYMSKIASTFYFKVKVQGPG